MRSHLVAGVAGFALGIVIMLVLSSASCDGGGDDPTDAPADTVAGVVDDYEDEVDDIRTEVEVDPAEAAGMRSTIEQLRETVRGLERRGPRTVTVYRDRFVEVPATGVTDVGAVGRDGRLTLWTLTPIDSVPGAFEPRRLDDIDVRDCDDGWRFTANGVICDRARFGHVEVHARVGGLWDGRISGDVAHGIEGAGGLTWESTYRSAFRVEVERVGRWMDPTAGVDGIEWWWRAGVRTGWRVF